MSETQSQLVPLNALEAQLRDPIRQGELLNAMPFDTHDVKVALMQQFIDLVRNPPASIQGADPKSLFDCVQASARLGLQLSSPLGQAYAVKFGNKAQLIVGYRGLVKLMRAGGVREIHTGTVCENDAYEWTESDFRMTRTIGERGEVVGVFAKLVMEDGSTQSEVMTVEEVEHVRSKSRAAKSGPWVTDWVQMARKTVLRRAANLVNLKDREAALVARADRTEFDYDATVEVRRGPQERPKRGAQALMAELEAPQPSAPDAAPDEPRTVDVTNFEEPPMERPPEFDPDTGEMIPDELPLPGAEPPPGKPKAADPLHLARAQRLAKRLGLPSWQKITDERRKLLVRRMEAEGIGDPSAFWNAAERVLGRVTADYWDQWADQASLDVLLRVPQRGNPDHWQKLSEGTAQRKAVHAPLREEGAPRASAALQDLMGDLG